MRCESRTAARAAVLILAVCIAVDFATPLLPGAFRFEMTESVEAGGRPGLRPATSVAPDGPAPTRVPLVRRDSVLVPASGRLPETAVPRVRDVFRPARADSPPDSAEDH